MSVVELLVVVTIIGILGSIGFLNIRRDTPQVNESSRVLAADLLWARSEAIRLNARIKVSFDATGESYTVTFRDRGASADSTLLKRNLYKDFPLADMASARFASGASTLYFDPRGLPRTATGASSSGEIVLRSSQDQSYTVSVTVASQGRIQVERP